jgi:hypothetical protein
MKFIENGNFSRPVRDVFIVIGIGLIWGSAYVFGSDVRNSILWICVSVGTVLAGVGGWSSFANRVGVKPFGNNWRSIRKTYDKNDGEKDSQ